MPGSVASVFISHASVDREIAKKLCFALENRGVRCWLAIRDVLPGDNFQAAVVRAIRASKVMLLVFTANANNSEQIKKELALASRMKVTLIPLRWEDIEPDAALLYEFAIRQWIDMVDDWEREMKQLVERIEEVERRAAEEQRKRDGIAAARRAEDERKAREQAEAERRAAEEKRKRDEIAAAAEVERKEREQAEVERRAAEEQRKRGEISATEAKRIKRRQMYAERRASEQQRRRDEIAAAQRIEDERRNREQAEAERRASEEQRKRDAITAARRAEDERKARERAEAERRASKERASRDIQKEEHRDVVPLSLNALNSMRLRAKLNLSEFLIRESVHGTKTIQIGDILTRTVPTSAGSNVIFNSPRIIVSESDDPPSLHKKPVLSKHSRLPWMIVTFAAAAGLLTWIFRHEVASLAAGIFKLISSSAAPPIALDTRQTQLVDISAFGPRAVLRGSQILIQIYLHHSDLHAEAAELARESDALSMRRAVATIEANVTIGQRLNVTLDTGGAPIDAPSQYLIWRGESRACQFVVSIPGDFHADQLMVRATVFADTVPLGAVRFTMQIKNKASLQDLTRDIQGDQVRRYRRAFLSYASADRAEVLKRAQALKAARIEFFHDLLSLAPGERWEQRLYEEIDRCDLFLLFWSSHAVQSKWVIAEAERALGLCERDEEGSPDIVPIVLEGPPVPLPPDSLSTIHFNDALRYVISAVEAETRTS